MSSAEEAKLVARAESLIKQFNFVGARLLLAHALEKGSARAAFMMAETYDWQILRSLQAYGVRGDAQMAREFYQLAAAAGIETARERGEALQAQQRAAPKAAVSAAPTREQLRSQQREERTLRQQETRELRKLPATQRAQKQQEINQQREQRAQQRLQPNGHAQRMNWFNPMR